MAEILSSRRVKTRAPHVCFGCTRKFPAGAEMQREGVADGGSVFTAYLCETCHEVQHNLDFGDAFGFGELLDGALEYEAALSERSGEDG